jgi:hypothetical protein
VKLSSSILDFSDTITSENIRAEESVMMVRHYCLDEEEEVVRMLRKEGMELERAERVARDEVAWMLEWRRREELERKKRRVGRQKARCGREGRTWGMYGGALLCAVGWEGVGRRGCVCGSSELGGMMEWFVSL